MDSQADLVSLVLDYVLSERKGHTPAYYEHVTRLTLPFYVEDFKVYRILGVNDSGLVRELQQNDVNSINEQDGVVFEVYLAEGGETRFYYVATGGRFQLIAQDGDSPQTIGELLRLRGGKQRRTSEKSDSATPQLEEWLQDDGEDTSLAVANAVARLLIIPGVERKLAKLLTEAGFDTVEKVALADKNELAAAVPGLNIVEAEHTINQAQRVLEKMESGDLSPDGWSKSGSSGKPVRVVRLASMPEPEEKPTRIERREVGKCTYCSGTLVEKGGVLTCRECGKMEQTNRSEHDARAIKLRRQLRR
jgi:hypothetical protein